MPRLAEYNTTDFTFTTVPNAYYLLSDTLSSAEQSVMTYIYRRTVGHKCFYDYISLTQFQYGVTKTDGTKIDAGTGLSRPAITRAIKKLVKHGLILHKPGSPTGASYYELTLRALFTPEEFAETYKVQLSDAKSNINDPIRDLMYYYNYKKEITPFQALPKPPPVKKKASRPDFAHPPSNTPHQQTTS